MAHEPARPLPGIAWQRYFDGPIASRPLALGDGVVVCVPEGEAWTVRRIPLDPGGPEWNRTIDGIPSGPACRTGRVLVLPLQGGRLCALDLASGLSVSPAWNALPGEISGPLLARRSRIYVGLRSESGGQLAALEVGRPAPLWVAEDASASWTLLLHPHGLMAGGGNGIVALTCLAPATGEIRWKREEIHGTLLQLWSPGDGTLELLGDTCGVCRLDPESGEVLGERSLGMEVWDARLVSNLLLAVAVEPPGARLLAMTAVGLEVLGQSPMGVTRLVDADTTEALVEDDAGRTRLLTLPELEPTELEVGDELPPCRFAAWARDAAYLVDTTGQVLTAVDLAPQATEPWRLRENA